MVTQTRFRRFDIDSSLLPRIGWMVFSAMWVFMLPQQWLEWYALEPDPYESRFASWHGWKPIGLVLTIAFVGIYLHMLFDVFVVRRGWSEHFTASRSQFIRWSLMAIAVVMNLMPASVPVGARPSEVPNWAVAFTFVGIAWAITSAGRGAVIAVLQVFGVAAFLQILDTPQLPQWGTVFFGLAIGLVVAGQVINQDLIGDLYIERGRVRDQAVTDERFRIARDLHDTVGHSMTQITLKAELARRVLPTDPDRAAAELTEVEALSRRLARDIRSAVAGEDQVAFADEVVRSRQFLESMNIASSFSSDGSELPDPLDAVIAWCVREGVMNVVKHADAHRAEISLLRRDGALELTIQDDGKANRPLGGQGHGLRGMRERVQEHGGSVQLEPAEQGHRLVVRVPAP